MALPTPTVLGPVAGYIPTGTRRYLWVDTIADIAAATSAELTAGTDLTPLISATTGFSGTGNTVDFPNAASRWTPKIAGLISADDSSFTLNMALAGSGDGLDLFSDGSDGTDPTTGFFVICYEGISATSRMRVFPCQVTSVQESADITVGATADVMVAIIEPPSALYTVPAA
ncbi:MAG TPA: hypothetical protein VG497_30795 [Kribbella sp.]|nr:hypothetical protein [Kribbella sp.]